MLAQYFRINKNYMFKPQIVMNKHTCFDKIQKVNLPVAVQAASSPDPLQYYAAPGFQQVCPSPAIGSEGICSA